MSCAPQKPEFYASLAGWHRPEAFLRILDSLSDVACQGIELQARGFDEWIEYPVLEKLNAGKRSDAGHLAAMRRCFAEAHRRGLRVGLWTHELWTPPGILDAYPELRTARGDINLSHPMLADFVRARLERFFQAAPEVDFLVLSLTETTWPVMHRFDNAMDPVACTRWILGLYDEVCRCCGRELVVRPFSAVAADYDTVRRALEAFPHVAVMEKSDPYDWDMHLPLNPFLRYYPGRFLVMEFDISAEYFGCNRLPAVALEYLKERFEYGESLGVRRYVGRLTRYGHNTLDSVNRPNALYAAEFFSLADRDPRRFLRRVAPGVYPQADDPDAVADALEGAWRVIERVFYVNGQLLIDAFWGDLRILLNNLFFEIVRPNHSLAHAARQWPILADRTTPSAEAIRREKADALAEAQALLERVRRAAGREPAFMGAFEELVAIADLFGRLTALGQAYVREIEAPEGTLVPEAEAMRDIARSLRERWGADYFGERVRGGLPAAVESLTQEFLDAFTAERALRARWAVGGDVEDVILPGFPCEGHLPSKTSHGAGAFCEEGRWARRITHETLTYTGRAAPGPKSAEVEVRGCGRLAVNGRAVQDFEDADWTAHSLAVEAPEGVLQFTFSRTGTPPPAVRLILVRSSDAPSAARPKPASDDQKRRAPRRAR